MNKTVIATQGLSKAFGTKNVLNGVDMQLERGCVLGLLGTNGSGKSTLIKCLLGLLKIDTGSATVFGDDPWKLFEETKAKIGYVPQVVSLYPWMKVRQVVQYTAAFYTRWDHDWVHSLAETWDVPLEDRVVGLSTGQLQKIAILLALGHHPELLILDEPAASLDPVARREFLASLVKIAEDGEHTILFSTHITSDLERVASHVAVLQKGMITHFNELDVLKDRMKRLRITAHTDLPASFSVEGALRSEFQGRNALVAVPHVDDDLLDSLRSRWQADVVVEDLNLEEIFLEMHDD